MLYVMTHNKFPFGIDMCDIRSMMGVFTKDLRIDQSVDKSCADLIEHLLSYSPVTRYNIDQVMNHPWIAKKCISPRTLCLMRLKQFYPRQHSFVNKIEILTC